MRPLVSLLFHDVYRVSPGESGFNGPTADRYKLDRVAFRSMLGALRAADRPAARIAAAGDLAGAEGVAITVDDGGVSFLGEVADAIEPFGWRAHAFVTTNEIGRPGFLNAAHLRDLNRRGHVIGTHSATHPARFSACSPERMRREWRDSRRALEDVLGHDVTVASLPGGYFSPDVARSAALAGLAVLFTSEPTRRTRLVGGCTILGRFTVVAGESPGTVGALAAGAYAPFARQWVAWTAKKVLKSVLGPSYSTVGAWFLAGGGAPSSAGSPQAGPSSPSVKR